MRIAVALLASVVSLGLAIAVPDFSGSRY